MLRIGMIGVGRIGLMHAKLVHESQHACVTWCCDNRLAEAKEAARVVGARATVHHDELLSAPDVDAVIIASSTQTHIDMILRCAVAGKPVLCEKPVGLDIERVKQCAQELARYSVPVQLGFNRRFDPSHRAVRDAVHQAEIGALEQLIITSRDPEPPSASHLKDSGGLMHDMTIHDFDMARYILPEEPVSIVALGANLVDPSIGQLGDIDTVSVLLRTRSGIQCIISNTRRCVYGYDQRVEAFGSLGMIRSDNQRQNSVYRSDSTGTDRAELLQSFFVERYQVAYQEQIKAFVDVAQGRNSPSVDFNDGQRALILANAAYQSLSTGRVVQIEDSFMSDS